MYFFCNTQCKMKMQGSFFKKQEKVTLKVQNFFLEHMVVFCGIVGPLIICATLLLVLKSAHMQLSRKWAMESDCSG